MDKLLSTLPTSVRCNRIILHLLNSDAYKIFTGDVNSAFLNEANPRETVMEAVALYVNNLPSSVEPIIRVLIGSNVDQVNLGYDIKFFCYEISSTLMALLP